MIVDEEISTFIQIIHLLLILLIAKEMWTFTEPCISVHGYAYKAVSYQAHHCHCIKNTWLPNIQSETSLFEFRIHCFPSISLFSPCFWPTVEFRITEEQESFN